VITFARLCDLLEHRPRAAESYSPIAHQGFHGFYECRVGYEKRFVG